MAIKSHIVTEREANPRLAVEKELRELRNANRLAIHMNENCNDAKYGFSKKTWKWFKTPPEDILVEISRSRHGKTTLPLLSMSLLPAKQKAIKPYWAGNEYAIKTYGYLVDLRQEQRHPPRVVGGHETNIQSFNDPFAKKFLASYLANHELFEEDMQKLMHKPAQWMRACGDPVKGAKVTNTLLDRLGACYSTQKRFVRTVGNKPNLFMHNEIIVAASKEHIRAIAIPIYDKSFAVAKSAYAPMATLIGALVGLSHLNQNPQINLPVVMYHMEKTDGIEIGDITYLGHGRKELFEIALQSIKELQAIEAIQQDVDRTYERECLESATIETLGIEIDKPLSEQKARVVELKKQWVKGSLNL